MRSVRLKAFASPPSCQVRLRGRVRAYAQNRWYTRDYSLSPASFFVLRHGGRQSLRPPLPLFPSFLFVHFSLSVFFFPTYLHIFFRSGKRERECSFNEHKDRDKALGSVGRAYTRISGAPALFKKTGGQARQNAVIIYAIGARYFFAFQKRWRLAADHEERGSIRRRTRQ